MITPVILSVLILKREGMRKAPWQMGGNGGGMAARQPCRPGHHWEERVGLENSFRSDSCAWTHRNTIS